MSRPDRTALSQIQTDRNSATFESKAEMKATLKMQEALTLKTLKTFQGIFGPWGQGDTLYILQNTRLPGTMTHLTSSSSDRPH